MDVQACPLCTSTLRRVPHGNGGRADYYICSGCGEAYQVLKANGQGTPQPLRETSGRRWADAAPAPGEGSRSR